MSVPYITTAGWSGSGKTTFFEQVVAILRGEGLRVGVVKHHHSEALSFDTPGKDSARYSEAGADPVLLVGNRCSAFFEHDSYSHSLESCVARFEGLCDLVIVEGFADETTCGYELVRSAHKVDPILAPERMAGLITDDKRRADEARRLGIALFSLDNPQEVAHAIRARLGL